MDPEKIEPVIPSGGEAPPPPPPGRLPPPPLPPMANVDLLRRLERAESVIEDLRRQAAAAEEEAKERAAKAASKDEVKNIDLRMSDLAAAYDGLGRAFAREGELAARLELAENALAEFKTQLPGQQLQLKTKMEIYI